MQDRIPDGYTILKLGRTKADLADSERAIRSHGAPVTVLDVPDRIARDIYGHDLILLWPDLHVVWRGNTAPEYAAEAAVIATGHLERDEFSPNRLGFPNHAGSDSTCWLGKEASMDGQALF